MCVGGGGAALRGYWRKRFITVWIPYAFIECILYILIKPTIKEILLDVMLLKPQFVLGWYLNYLLLWYTTFWVIYKLPALKSERAKVAVLCTTALIYMIYFGETSPIRFEQSLAFISGVLITVFYEKWKKYCKRNSCVLLMLIAVLALMLKQSSFIRECPRGVLCFFDLVIKTCAGWAVVIIVCLRTNQRKRQKTQIEKILILMGNSSYEIYLVHGLILQVCKWENSHILTACFIIIWSIVGTMILYKIDCIVKRRLRGILQI